MEVKDLKSWKLFGTNLFLKMSWGMLFVTIRFRMSHFDQFDLGQGSGSFYHRRF